MSALERSIRDIIRGDESDGELDKIVADLIVREAQEKNQLERNGGNVTSGSSNSSPSIRRSLNTRFLNGIVRGVERHNRTLKEDEERNAVAVARGGSEAGKERDRTGRREGKMHGWEDEINESQHSLRTSSLSHPRDTKEGSSRSRHDESRSKSRRNDSKREEKRSYERSDSRRRDGKRERSFDPESKMDKYFRSDYDPALDVDAKVSVNQDNLVEDEGWERAMSVIGEHKREREERRKARRLERGRKRSKTEDKKRHRESEDKNIDSRLKERKDHYSESRNLILETQYSSKVSVREWDKGKN